MSLVTSALVLVRHASPVAVAALCAPLSFDTSHDAGSFQRIDLDGAGGSKFMEVDAYAAGLNYVAPIDLEVWFQALPWGEGGSALLVWDRNGEGGGTASVRWETPWGL